MCQWHFTYPSGKLTTGAGLGWAHHIVWLAITECGTSLMCSLSLTHSDMCINNVFTELHLIFILNIDKKMFLFGIRLIRALKIQVLIVLVTKLKTILY